MSLVINRRLGHSFVPSARRPTSRPARTIICSSSNSSRPSHLLDIEESAVAEGLG